MYTSALFLQGLMEINKLMEDERIEIKLGGKSNIANGTSNLELLTHRLKEDKLKTMISRNIITGGELSYHDYDTGVNVISLWHLRVNI